MDLQSLAMWNKSNDAFKNCAAFDRSSSSFQLITCVTRLSYICKVSFFLYILLRFTTNFFSIIYNFQIKILFPGSCFNPPYSRDKDAISELDDALQTEMVSRATKIQKDPGIPFYFKCNSKQYTGIMAPVNIYFIILEAFN
jgi:hypothetical protein